MAKNLIIGGLLIIIIVILVYIAARPPTTVTIPVQQPVLPEERGTPTPKAPELDRGTPTPAAKETTPLPAGVPETIFPQEVNFYVNEIRVPEVGLDYMPIKENNLKTFAGSFGPYYDDPTQRMKVILCAEFYKVQAAPACETVPIIYRDRYVSFAKGYQYDEYIGGMAAKDYIAYYDVYSGNTRVATSSKATIRTVRD